MPLEGYEGLINESLNELGTDDSGAGADLSNQDNSAAPAAPTNNTIQEYEYTARGQKIKEPIDMILKRASQGYDYAQNVADLRKQREELEGTYSPYKQIYEAAQNNPEWWQQITKAYSEQGYNQQDDNQPQHDPNDPQAALLGNVEKMINEKLSKVENFMNETLAEKNLRLRQEEDDRLNKEIEDVRKQYAQQDFTTPDETGKTLEYKVLEYASKNGIKSFKTAFRDFYFDQLMAKTETAGKEKALAEMQKRTKLGLLGESPTPRKQISESDHRGKSYSDLASEAIAELGL